MDFEAFGFLELPVLDFVIGRNYIEHVNILSTASYGSGLRKETQSVFELVDIKMVVKGSTIDRQPRGDEEGNRRN